MVCDTARLVVAGVLIALPAVFGLGRLVESQLFGVAPMDALTLAAAAALVGCASLVTAAAPARRATAVSPVEALRHE